MDPTQLQPGYRLDRYELLCPLAYGGMASVWLARFGGRLGFERLVVIKMILPQFSQDPRFQEMFLDEARIASKIEHANVARILDVGEHGDNYFIVMEWVDGDSLSKILRAAEARKQRVPIGIALRVCADAAAGLHAAHELKDRDGSHLGVVHRDVSPQNILVGNNGSTLIIDFGVAKARDRVSQETSAGQLKGKIRYMAPEQALGQDIDHRADVWAIGAMLYEMFTGLPPYDGPNEVATLHKLTSGEKPPPLPSSLPAVLRSVTSRALAYDPEDRFASAHELNGALEEAMVTLKTPTTPAIVAQYTAELLADRKAARRRAVDNALENARRREAAASSRAAIPVGPTSSGTLPLSYPSTQALSAAPAEQAPPSVQAFASTGETSALSSAPRSYEAPSLPSTASSGTMGSSAIEYSRPPDIAAHRKRNVGAAALGVSFAAGAVGLALILGSTWMRSSASTPATGRPAIASSSSAPGTAPTPPSVVPPPASVTNAFVAPASAPGPTGLPEEPNTPPPATSRPATTTAMPSNAIPSASTHVVTTHRPPPVLTTKPKPTTTGLAPVPTRPDRGF